ncbi:MAG: outer membrane beta-barrel protein [Daejeonella sp.]|uniref:outer membrane beta-barrel protein n=1 Tax=Daejeonella sp. TaxID=2805397 RepID=UPI002736C57F|nr:outer membrane beta-barrel protein [Daejeonella sp.]MDP3470141.1 outer membrane beta-barrel protein [Daejeonella sp.]
MKETEDQRIAAKFRQVFEDFEDPASNEGWLELRKKYPEEKGRPLFFWISSAAAVLIVLSGLWLYIPEINQEPIITINKTSIESKKTESETSSSEPQLSIPAPAPSKLIVKELQAGSDTKPASILSSSFHEEEKLLNNHPDDYSKTSDRLVISAKDSASTYENPVAKSPKTAEEPAITQDTMVLAMEEVRKTDFNLKPKSEELKLTEEKEKKSEKSSKKNFSLSLYAGSFINYAEGSENNVNMGAGLSSDFRISKNLRISTGLNLSKNSLAYNQNEPANNYGSFQDANSSIVGTLVALSNYEAELLGLDIPVNVKYLFNPEKSSTYFLAGLSSGTYLSEKYAVKQSNFNSFVGSSAAANKQEISRQLKDFDLMRTLNVSFGFNTHLSKKQSLTIEPFLKYPLGGLGSENIRFGASGINVKLNFNTAKKP